MPPNTGTLSNSNSSSGAGAGSGKPPPPMPTPTSAASNPYLPYFLHLQQQHQLLQQYPMTLQNHHLAPPPPLLPPLPPPPAKPQSAASAAAARRQKTQAATAARMLRAKSSVVSTVSSPASSTLAPDSNLKDIVADHHPSHSTVPLSATLRSLATPATHLQGNGSSQSQSQSHRGPVARGSSIASRAVTPEIRSPLIHSSLPAADASANYGRQRTNRRAQAPAAATTSLAANAPPPHPRHLPVVPMLAVKTEPPSQAPPATGTLAPPPHLPSVPPGTDPNVALAIWRAVFDMHGIPAPPMPANISAAPHSTHPPPPPPPLPMVPSHPPPPPAALPPPIATSANSAPPPHHSSHPLAQPHQDPSRKHDQFDEDGDMDADGDADHEDDGHGDPHRVAELVSVPAADPQQELRKERKVNREQERRMKIKETTRKLGEVVGLPRQANMLVVLTHALEHIQTTRSQADELKTLKEALLLEGIEYDDLITRAKARRSMQDAERVLSKPLSRSVHGSSTAPASTGAASAAVSGYNQGNGDESDGGDETRMVVDSAPGMRKNSRTRDKATRGAAASGTDSSSAVDVAGALLALHGSSAASTSRIAQQQPSRQHRPQHGSSSSMVPSARHCAQSPAQVHRSRPHQHSQPPPLPSYPPSYRQHSPIYIDHDDDERQARQGAAHDSSFSHSPLFGTTATPFQTDHTDEEEDLMIVDDEPPQHQHHQLKERHRVNGIVGSSVELDPWTPAPSAPPPPLAAPSSGPLHPPVLLPPPPPLPISDPPMPASASTDFMSLLPPGPLTASILNAFAAAAAAAMAASQAPNALAPPAAHAMASTPPTLPFVAAPSNPPTPPPPLASAPAQASGTAPNAFAATGFPFWPMHPQPTVASSQAPPQPPLPARAPALSTHSSAIGDENGHSASAQKPTTAPPPAHSARVVQHPPPPPAPPCMPLSAQAPERANGSPVIRGTGKQQAPSQAQQPIRSAAGNPLKARSVLPSSTSSSSSSMAPPTTVASADKQTRHSPYPAAGPARRAPPGPAKSTLAPPLPPPSSRPNPHAILAPPPPAPSAPLSKRASLDRPLSATPARSNSARAHLQGPPPPLSATKSSSRDSGSSINGVAGGLLSTTNSSSSSSAAAALATANAPGTPTKGVRLDIFALDSDEDVAVGGAWAKRLSATTAAAAGKESSGTGRRRALDKHKSMSVECLGVASSRASKHAPASGTQASAPASSSLVDELDMLLGCRVIPSKAHRLADAPAHSDASAVGMTDHHILASMNTKSDAEADPMADVIVDMILRQGPAAAHAESTQGDATPAPPEWDPLDWLTGGSPARAPHASIAAANGWVVDKENTAPPMQSADDGGQESGPLEDRDVDGAKAAGESRKVMEWDIDRILMGS